MAGVGGGSGSNLARLNLTPDEQRLFKQVFNLANPDGIEVVTGDTALRFLPDRTKLPSETLGEIWQLADSEDKGFITEEGFYILLRLAGYAQAGRHINGELALKPGGPLPRLEGINLGPAAASPLQAQSSGGPIKVPPLSPENAQRYAALFEQSGAQNGILDGVTAKSIFDHSKLPNEILVRIWNLADTESRGQLSITEFIIAMHLIASYRSGAMRALPRNLPAGLYDAAARRGVPSRPISGGTPSASIPRQFSGPTTPRTSSPLAGRSVQPPPPQPPVQAQTTGGWLVTPQEKSQYDAQFAKLDTQNQGFLSGESAAAFFGNSQLSEDDLAQIWDLADMNSEGQLNRDSFAVAMYLIRNRLNNRGPVPKTLPASLIPPSMRQGQSAPVAGPASPSKPKSAVDDLFGLDALSDSAPQVPQSTGDSSATPAPTPAHAPISPSHTAQSSQPSHSTFFKPFVPTSSFGQAVVSPQTTGISSQPTGSSTSHNQPRSLDQSFSQTTAGNDDLLGDTDPEVSKRLTNETTELANLSNQVGNLATQMQEVKNKNSAVDTNMSNVSKQKQAFEARLAQLRTAYEQEARDLRIKEERLATVENESKKLQSDLAMVQHTYTSLQEKKQQAAQSIEAQQQEITGYKEQLRNINAQVAQIKPEIDKAESALRQQKGLNAITKKQVSTAEAEYERLREQMDGLTRDNEEAIKEAKNLDETHRDIQSRQSTSSVPAASPSPSSASQSTNPFFRRQTTSSSANLARSPTGQESVQSPNHSAFDSFFNTAFPATEGTSAPPVTSFSGTPNIAAAEVPAVQSPAPSGTEKEPSTPTQAESKVPPPPPQSRQITSSALPLVEKVVAPVSPSSSIGVAPPTSRFGESPGHTTPTKERQTMNEPTSTLSPLNQTQGANDALGDSEASNAIPGSFPGDSTPPEVLAESSEAKRPDDPFGTDDLKRSGSSKDDFDSAFAGFEDKGKSAEPLTSFPSSARREEEFPPIQVFENDSDSDSDDAGSKGFEDNFTTPERGAGSATAAVNSTRPDFSRGNSVTTPLPDADAQQSPPAYDTSSGQQNSKPRTDSNQFPAEYGGLLPSREVPTSPEADVTQQTSAQIEPITSHADADAAAAPAAPSASDARQPAAAEANDDFDDFDKEFGDLSEANVADDKGDDELGASRHADFSEDFNPTFDSPAPSKMTASSAFGTSSGFDDFEANVSGPTQASTSSAVPATGAGDHDWDAMFAGLGKDTGVPQTNGGTNDAHAEAADVFNSAAGSGGAAPGLLQTPTKPPLTRGLTETGEHDDPILKRLTAMGYPRDQSLAALEKFDYNIDKAADFLTQQ